MVKHEIAKVFKNSIAAQLDISSGDFLLSINGKEVKDILDYRFRIQEEKLMVEIEKSPKEQSEIWELDIEKNADQDLGLEFKQSLMSHTKRCSNNCVFCFVDQQPKGLRPSLYVKDDDPRLSFLLGNYVTLTNLSTEEVKRLAGYHVSPLRISVHAADLDIRAKMMGTDRARNLFEALDIFRAHGIEMHFQSVLCKGLNDGIHLMDTIEKLLSYKPFAKSLAIVPAGLTKHRDGLYPLEPFSKEDARNVVTTVESLYTHRAGQADRFVHLSDEWYILAELQLPKYKDYGSFPQLDNGVGILRLFQKEFLDAFFANIKKEVATQRLQGKSSLYHNIKKHPYFGKRQHKFVPTIGIITGTAAAGFMTNIVKTFAKKHPYSQIDVRPIRNTFFGETVTVSGLLTGQDIITQLKQSFVPSILFIAESAFRSGVKEKIMLDGTTLNMLENVLNTKVIISSTNGDEFYRQLAKACYF